MELQSISLTVMQALELANLSRSDDNQIPISDSCQLFGQSGYLDSMALVALLMDIEDALQEQGIDVSLSDERAMSLSRSPFQNVNSMSLYIQKIITEYA